MIVLSWVPAVWRKVMDKRVLAHYDGDITRANLHPSKADAYLKKYGARSVDTAAA
jgi:alkane 1-monooxygenase